MRNFKVNSCFLIVTIEALEGLYYDEYYVYKDAVAADVYDMVHEVKAHVF